MRASTGWGYALGNNAQLPQFTQMNRLLSANKVKKQLITDERCHLGLIRTRGKEFTRILGAALDSDLEMQMWSG